MNQYLKFEVFKKVNNAEFMKLSTVRNMCDGEKNGAYERQGREENGSTQLVLMGTQLALPDENVLERVVVMVAPL